MRLTISMLLLAMATACGIGPNSPVVGGECSTDRDCEKVCSMEDDFGTGMCTVRCSDDQDCPEGSVCTDRDDGICAVSCAVADDCSGFGRAFTCKNVKRASGGDVAVCRLP